jgi:putative SOS response-associated peptidase YedK
MILNSMTGYWMRSTPDQAAAIMKPYAGGIEAWEVGPVVGNVRNNRRDLMDRVRLLYACNVRFASEVGH